MHRPHTVHCLSLQQLERTQTWSSGDFKAALTEVVVQTVCPIGAEFQRLMGDAGHLDAVLGRCNAKARTIAEDTMSQVRGLVGLHTEERA
jgi:hypothetical protein